MKQLSEAEIRTSIGERRPLGHRADAAAGPPRGGLGRSRVPRLARSVARHPRLPRLLARCETPLGLVLRAAESRPQVGAAICSLCNTQQPAGQVTLFSAAKAGEAGARGQYSRHLHLRRSRLFAADPDGPARVGVGSRDRRAHRGPRIRSLHATRRVRDAGAGVDAAESSAALGETSRCAAEGGTGWRARPRRRGCRRRR